MLTSDSIKELATALAKAQAEITDAKKDATNPHFNKQYADLASIWDACRAALTKNGISVVQMTRPSDAQEVVVITRLCHSSGEWMQGELALPVTKGDAQGYGSALTYARRYALAAAVGVAPEDDDAQAAVAARPAGRPAAAIPANVEGQTAWAQMDAATRDMLAGYAEAATKLVNDGKDAHGYLEALGLDDDTKLALWTQLAAPVRAAIKKGAPKAALATQP